MRSYFVYILSSSTGTLYTGVTCDIWYRVLAHKQKKKSGFTKKYNVTRLIYFEETRYILDALAREKEIKGWSRKKKIDLVRNTNPRFEDLSAVWFYEEDLDKAISIYLSYMEEILYGSTQDR